MSGYTIYYIDQAGFAYRLNDNINVFLRPSGMRGFGQVKAQAQTEQLPYHDGTRLVGRVYTGERTMEIALQSMVDSLTELAALSRQMIRNCNPYKDPEVLGALKVVTPDGLERQIDCWLIEWPDMEGEGPADAVVTPVFWAPLPWFYDPEEQSEIFALDILGGAGYPVEYVDPTGIEYVDADIDVDIFPINAGDVDAWPVIRITGPGQDPTIENVTTGKVFELTAGGGIVLDVGDYVEIDMRESTVVHYDATDGSTTSITEKMSDASEFWPLQRGANELHIELSDSGSGSAFVTWYNQYLSGL